MRLIHLVDGDDDVDARRFRVVDRLDGLRHDTVIGGDDQNRDVGRLRASCTHGGKGFVTRGIEEGDLLAMHGDAIGADVLGDTARLALGHAGVTDCVEQGGLTMVDVTHDADDRATLHEVLVGVLLGLKETFLDCDDDLFRDFDIELFRDEVGGIVVDLVRDLDHHTVHHELLHDLGGGFLHAGGELTDRDGVGDGDLKLFLACLLELHSADALLRGALFFPDVLALRAGILLLELLSARVTVGPAGGGIAGDETLIISAEVDLRRTGVDDAHFRFCRNHRLDRLGRAVSGAAGNDNAVLAFLALLGFFRFLRLGGGRRPLAGLALETAEAVDGFFLLDRLELARGRRRCGGRGLRGLCRLCGCLCTLGFLRGGGRGRRAVDLRLRAACLLAEELFHAAGDVLLADRFTFFGARRCVLLPARILTSVGAAHRATVARAVLPRLSRRRSPARGASGLCRACGGVILRDSIARLLRLFRSLGCRRRLLRRLRRCGGGGFLRCGGRSLRLRFCLGEIAL